MQTRLPFTSLNTPLSFMYTNWRGETARRIAILTDIYFGETDYHPEPQWLVKGTDLERGEVRIYALKDIKPVDAAKETPRPAPAPPAPSGEPAPVFTMPIKADPARVRTDLPKTFVWTPKEGERKQAHLNHRKSLETLADEGGVTWAELAAILKRVPPHFLPELRAVAACVLLYPQKGFVL